MGAAASSSGRQSSNSQLGTGTLQYLTNRSRSSRLKIYQTVERVEGTPQVDDEEVEDALLEERDESINRRKSTIKKVLSGQNSWKRLKASLGSKTHLEKNNPTKKPANENISVEKILDDDSAPICQNEAIAAENQKEVSSTLLMARELSRKDLRVELDAYAKIEKKRKSMTQGDKSNKNQQEKKSKKEIRPSVDTKANSISFEHALYSPIFSPNSPPVSPPGSPPIDGLKSDKVVKVDKLDDDDLYKELLEEFQNERAASELVQNIFQMIPLYQTGIADVDKRVHEALKSNSLPVEARDSSGSTLLIKAAETVKASLIKPLLKLGVAPNAKNDYGFSALHYSCYKESASLEVAKILLERGASTDTPDNSSCTALHYAAAEGSASLVALLLFHKARMDLFDSNGCTPLDYAMQNGNSKCVHLLQCAVDSSSEWKACIDAETQYTYYYNIVTGETTWEKPKDVVISGMNDTIGVKSQIQSVLKNVDDGKQEMLHANVEEFDDLGIASPSLYDGDALGLNDEVDELDGFGNIGAEASVMFHTSIGDLNDQNEMTRMMDALLKENAMLKKKAQKSKQRKATRGGSGGGSSSASAKKPRKHKLVCLMPDASQNAAVSAKEGVVTYSGNDETKTVTCFDQIMDADLDKYQQLSRPLVSASIENAIGSCFLSHGAKNIDWARWVEHSVSACLAARQDLSLQVFMIKPAGEQVDVIEKQPVCSQDDVTKLLKDAHFDSDVDNVYILHLGNGARVSFVMLAQRQMEQDLLHISNALLSRSKRTVSSDTTLTSIESIVQQAARVTAVVELGQSSDCDRASLCFAEKSKRTKSR